MIRVRREGRAVGGAAATAPRARCGRSVAMGHGHHGTALVRAGDGRFASGLAGRNESGEGMESEVNH